MQPAASDITGFKRVAITAPYELTTRNKVAMILSSACEFDVFTVLLVRKKTVIAAKKNAAGVTLMKIEIPKIVDELAPTWVYEPEVEAAVKPKKAGPVRVALEGGVTKIQRCKELYAANVQMSREEMIALFIKEANCTPQGAVTYYITCKKA